MRPDGRDAAEGPAAPTRERVFDFCGRRGLGLGELSLVLTARLQGGPGPAGTVRVREISYETWSVLRTMGLDHLFVVVPGRGDGLN